MFRTTGRTREFAVAMLLTFVLCACASRSPGTGEAARDEGMARGNATQVEEVLAGKFPGVRVLRHGNGRLSVEIRGRSTFTGGTEPLYVIDGVPVDDSSDLIGINPNDIANIEVLKDINSLSFYGSRGANGVVLITMKRR